MSLLTFNKDKFYLDDKEFTIISGAMHYFRIPREYWYDRLLKLKECGFNLGRYYNDVGPQKTLYVPVPMLKEGENEIIVFETDSAQSNTIEFVDVPELG